MASCGPVSRKAGAWLDTKPSAPTSPAASLREMREYWSRVRYSSEAMVERWSGKGTPENLCFPNPHFCYVTLSCLFWIRLKFSLFRAYFLDFTWSEFFCLKTWFTGSLFQSWYSRFACYVRCSNGHFEKCHNHDFMGAIHLTKISENFGPRLNGSVRSNRKSFEKTERWTTFPGLTGWNFGWMDRALYLYGPAGMVRLSARFDLQSRLQKGSIITVSRMAQ